MVSRGIILREATIEDCDDIYHWRNDSETREQSFNSKKISYKEHCQWIKKALEDTGKLFYIGLDDKNEKCGIVRFDMRGEISAEINVNVPSQNRGKGIGSQLISRSCALFFSETGKKLILARIKESNTASIKVFQKVGFSEIFRYNGITGGVVVFVLLASSEIGN